jgi:hypothetical protein
VSRSSGITKLRIIPTTKTESGISGGKMMTPALSLELSVMALLGGFRWGVNRAALSSSCAERQQILNLHR